MLVRPEHSHIVNLAKEHLIQLDNKSSLILEVDNANGSTKLLRDPDWPGIYCRLYELICGDVCLYA